MKIKLKRIKAGSYMYGEEFCIYRWWGDNLMWNWSISQRDGLGWEHVEHFSTLKECREYLSQNN